MPLRGASGQGCGVAVGMSVSAPFVYLFVCLFGASGLSCGTRELCCVTWALSLWCTDSLVMGRWLSCRDTQA